MIKKTASIPSHTTTTVPPRRRDRSMRALAGAFTLLVLSLPSTEAALLFGDNFNAPDTNNLDTSDQTGRRSGLLASSVQVRSALIQHGIVNNQLNILRTAGGPGRIRFQDAASLAWWDFASGVGGSQILSDGGLRIDFDWLPADNTSDNWISYNVGFLGQSAGEPGFRVNEPQTDFGVLFRNNGGTQYFDNGAATTGASFDVSGALQHHLSLTYSFNSFADGSNVLFSAAVDGVSVLDSLPFQWDNNSGALYMELGNLATGTRIDNLAIASVPEPTTLGILSTAGLGLGLIARRRRTN